MRWDDIRTFLAVARAGSLSGGARDLGVHHATALRHVDALEAALETRLFDRGRDGLGLTQAGETLMGHAEALEARALALERAVKGADQQPVGEVRLSAPEALLPLLMPALAEVQARWPGLQVCGEFTDRAVDLARGEADLVVRPTREPPLDALGHRVAGVAWAVYAPESAPADAPDPPWVAYGPSLSGLPAAAWWRAQHGGEAVRMTVNSVPAAAAVVRAGAGRAVLPCFMGAPDPALRRVGPPIPEAADELWILTHVQLRRTARVRVVLDHLEAAFADRVELLEGREG